MANKYIDSEKLIAAIESRMEGYKLTDGRFPTTTNIVRYEELSCFRNFITSLQQEQPEISLEKEIARFALNGGTGDNTPTIGEVARHFYEIGKTARKEQSK